MRSFNKQNLDNTAWAYATAGGCDPSRLQAWAWRRLVPSNGLEIAGVALIAPAALDPREDPDAFDDKQYSITTEYAFFYPFCTHFYEAFV